MKYILTERQILNLIDRNFDYEKEHKPLEGGWGATVDGKEVDGSVIALVQYANEYPTKEIDLDEIPKSLFDKDQEDEGEKTVKIGDKMVDFKDLNDKQKEEFKLKEKIIIDKADLDYPIVLVQLRNKKYKILDGNHRVQKARNKKLKKIKAKVIPSDKLLKKFS